MRFVLLLLSLTIAGCGGPAKPVTTITMATTTSTRDSGLLDVLVPMFERQTGIEVKVIAVGSGQALEMGRRGDADVLLTHAPDAEKQFVAEGYGTQRRLVMYNDFVLVGSKSDPANVREEDSITAAFTRIAKSESAFVSRGDESGTHMKEKGIWKQAGTSPQGRWYIQTGSGMAQTLRMASEKSAYTLSDRGTFLSQRDRLGLVIVSAGDPMLRNQYAVIVVDPKKHSHVEADAARQFADFLLSPETQAMIGSFGVEKYGEPLFLPHDAATEGNSQ